MWNDGEIWCVPQGYLSLLENNVWFDLHGIVSNTAGTIWTKKEWASQETVSTVVTQTKPVLVPNEPIWYFFCPEWCPWQMVWKSRGYVAISDYVGPEHDANGMGLGVEIVWSLAGTELTFFLGSLYGAVFCICSWNGVENTPVIWLLLNCVQIVKTCSTPQPQKWVGWVEQIVGRGQNWESWHRVTEGIHLRSYLTLKAWGKEEGGRLSLVMVFVFPNNFYVCWHSASQQVAKDLPTHRK